jgi:hypothetical protein
MKYVLTVAVLLIGIGFAGLIGAQQEADSLSKIEALEQLVAATEKQNQLLQEPKPPANPVKILWANHPPTNAPALDFELGYGTDGKVYYRATKAESKKKRGWFRK